MHSNIWPNIIKMRQQTISLKSDNASLAFKRWHFTSFPPMVGMHFATESCEQILWHSKGDLWLPKVGKHLSLPSNENTSFGFKAKSTTFTLQEWECTVTLQRSDHTFGHLKLGGHPQSANGGNAYTPLGIYLWV